MIEGYGAHRGVMQDAQRSMHLDSPSVSGERPTGARERPVPAGRFSPLTTLVDGRRARVLLAEDRERGGRVVLKLPKGDRERALAEMQREARALDRCRHASVVALLDHGVSEELGPFVALAPHEGRTLASLLEEHGALPEPWVLRALIELTAALQAVHSAGVVHGDVAPSNVLVASGSLSEAPRICLLDFGAATTMDDGDSPDLGTVAYLAPERMAGGPPSIASDTYALGALAYELLAGVPPFRAATSGELAWLHQHEAPRPLREVAPVEIDVRLERLVLACLHKDPEQRSRDLAQLRASLEELEAVADAAHGPGPGAARDEDELRATLLSRVREYWIENVLERTTAGVILVRQALVEVGGTASSEGTAESVGLSRAFDAATGALVLLGEPGFGKTVNLLRLARHLADRAASAERGSEPIPVVFTLSSWSDRAGDLASWMAGELCAKYQLLRRDAQALVRGRAILPLLDGLDDVPSEARERCVAALEHYLASRPGLRMAVTCRSADYRALARPLQAALTLELRPLADDDIARQLRAPSHSPLLTALRGDPILSELSRTPVLLHVMRVGLRDSTGFRGALDDRAQAVGAVFTAFVDAAVGEGSKLGGRQQETRAVLHQVAALQVTTGRTVFQLEDADPTWLGARDLRVSHALLSRFAAAALLAAAPMLSIGFSPLDNQGLPTSMTLATYLALVTTVVLGLGFGAAAVWRQSKPLPAPPSRLETAARGLGAGLALGAIIGACVYALYPYPMAFFMGIESGLIGAGVLGISRRKCLLQGRDVVPVESLGWSWRDVDRRAALALGLFATGFFALFSHFEEPRSGAYSAAALVVLGLAVLGHKSRDLHLRVRPNVGIHRTVRSSLTAAALAFAVSTILFGLTYGAAYGAAVGLALAGMTGLCFGGIDVINHYSVRWLLHRHRLLPFHAADRLDDGASVGLIRRVGSGYMFMHAMLAQHLARRGEAGA